MKERIEECIDILGAFCGKRDVQSLTVEQLKSKYELEDTDVMVLFGLLSEPFPCFWLVWWFTSLII